MAETLHIPEGIRFDCSGCGNCCLGWPVPVTSQDHSRILSLAPNLSAEPAFRKLSSKDKKLSAFTQTLEKSGDGRCYFLTETNQCKLHLDFGAQAKPMICRLFPHTFTHTPAGVYAAVSFASSAVLFNSGKLLSEQTDLLQEKLAIFEELFSDVKPDWSALQLVDGVGLAFDEYLFIEEKLLNIIGDLAGSAPLLERLRDAAALVASRLPAGNDPERLPHLEARRQVVDQLLLSHLHRLYFPENVFADGPYDLDSRALMHSLVNAPDMVHLEHGGKQIRFQEIINLPLGNLDSESADLLERFIFMRIFAKLYFGPTFAHLSLLSGFNHLVLLVCLIRIEIKLHMLKGHEITYLHIVEIIRGLERRLSQLNISKESAAILEVLLMSPSRLERVSRLAK